MKLPNISIFFPFLYVDLKIHKYELKLMSISSEVICMIKLTFGMYVHVKKSLSHLGKIIKKFDD